MSEYKFYKRPDTQINQIDSLQFLARKSNLQEIKGIINKEIFDIEYSFIKLSTIYYRIYTYIHIYININIKYIYIYLLVVLLRMLVLEQHNHQCKTN